MDIKRLKKNGWHIIDEDDLPPIDECDILSELVILILDENNFYLGYVDEFGDCFDDRKEYISANIIAWHELPEV